MKWLVIRWSLYLVAFMLLVYGFTIPTETAAPIVEPPPKAQVDNPDNHVPITPIVNHTFGTGSAAATTQSSGNTNCPEATVPIGPKEKIVDCTQSQAIETP